MAGSGSIGANMVNKKRLIEVICAQLERDLVALKAAAMETYAAATGEESQPENEYDTRALEASYLAGAQAKRVLDTEASLVSMKRLELREFDELTPIASSALVSLKVNDKKIDVFVVPTRGGMTLQFESKAIQVITLQSPLGESLMGLIVGDVAMVEKGNEVIEYEVLRVE